MVELKKYKVNSRNTGLLIIGVQKDICGSTPGFAYYDRNPKDVIPIQKIVDKKIIPLLNKARKNKIPILFLQATYRKNQTHVFENFFVKNTPGWEFYKIKPNLENPKETLIEKYTLDPFTKETGIKKWIRRNQIENILIAGFTTDQGVRTSALSIYKKELTPIILSDCVSTAKYKLSLHKQMLKQIKKHPNIMEINSKKLIFAKK